MSVTRYQALTQDFKLPPLAPAFREGWQAERAAARTPARNVARDADLFAAAAPAAPPRGWDAERSSVRAPPRPAARDEPASGTLLKTPPLAGAFREGWQSERFRPQPVARAVARDEQSSGTLLSVPPLATFREGWQSERFAYRPPARSVARDEQSSMTLLSTPPLATFREGWAAERCFVRAGRAPVAAYALDFKPPPPAPLSFPEGWSAERAVVPRALRSPVDAATVFLFPGVLATFREGWQSERVTPAPPRWRARADADAPSAAPPVPFLPEDPRAASARRVIRRPADDGSAPRGFVTVTPPEGWQSERFRYATVSRPPVDPATAFLSPGPLAPAFREGWRADARALPRPRPPRRQPVELPSIPPAAAPAAAVLGPTLFGRAEAAPTLRGSAAPPATLRGSAEAARTIYGR